MLKLPSSFNHSPLHENPTLLLPSSQPWLSKLLMFNSDKLAAPGKNRHMLHFYVLIRGNMKTYSPPIKKHVDFLIDLRKRALNDFCGPFKSGKKHIVHERRGSNRDSQKSKKAILTGKVAGEKKHHGEDDQKRDVCLQDSCEWRK